VSGIILKVNSSLNSILKINKRINRSLRSLYRSIRSLYKTITFSKTKAREQIDGFRNYKFINFFSSLKTWGTLNKFYLAYAYLLYKKAPDKINIYFIKHFLKILVDNSSNFWYNLKGESRTKASSNLRLYQTLNDYFFSPSSYFLIQKNSKWLSMEEIINHFLFYSEGPVLPSGFSQGSVEAPKGHLGVSIISQGSNKPVRSRVRSSILVMAGHLNNLVQNVGLGDFVVVVSASNIVVGEIDR